MNFGNKLMLKYYQNMQTWYAQGESSNDSTKLAFGAFTSQKIWKITYFQDFFKGKRPHRVSLLFLYMFAKILNFPQKNNERSLMARLHLN